MIARALPVLVLLAACAPDPPPATEAPRPASDTSNWQRAPTPSAAALRGTSPAVGDGPGIAPGRGSSVARRSR